MKQATGVVTVVQEGRFLLAGDDGRARLFVMAPAAAVEPQDLLYLMLTGARVTVGFEWAATQAALARHVVPADSQDGPRGVGAG
jgi:hypothetical protein